MKTSMVNQLKYFEGKVCTIFLGPINRSLDEKQLINYFVGLIETVDEDCIWALHPVIKTRSCYFIKNIYSITEEQVLDPNNPEDAKVIQDFEEQKAKTYNAPPQPAVQEDVCEAEHNNSPFVDVASITQLAQRAKQSLKKGK